MAAPPDTQKQTQGGCQNEETKKYGPNKRTDQNSNKELNKMEISNGSDAELKTVVIRTLKELRTSTAKKDPVRNEGYTN